jgi:hypothetical protein
VGQSGDDYEAENFANQKEYENKKCRLKAKRKRGREI